MLHFLILALLLSVTPGEAGTSCSSRSDSQEALHRYPPLLVFVSLSMPKAALQTLAKEVKAVGGTVVLRGLLQGDMTKTALYLKELGQPMVIDPTLFTAYRVQKVPTFILRTTSTDTAEQVVPHDRMLGHVSLTYAVETFAHNGAAAPQAQRLLKKLRRTV